MSMHSSRVAFSSLHTQHGWEGETGVSWTSTEALGDAWEEESRTLGFSVAVVAFTVAGAGVGAVGRVDRLAQFFLLGKRELVCVAQKSQDLGSGLTECGGLVTHCEPFILLLSGFRLECWYSDSTSRRKAWKVGLSLRGVLGVLWRA
jgi:hypothetical protein